MITIAKTDSANEISVLQTATQALGVLAISTGILRPGPVLTRGSKAISVRAALSLAPLTAGDGPFAFGIMAGDLTLSELEAYLELSGPLTPSDRPSVEIQTRGKYIRQCSMLIPTGNGTVAGAYLDNRSLSGLRYAEAGEAGQGGWDWWLYNLGIETTTGAIWTVQSSVFCRFNPSG